MAIILPDKTTHTLLPIVPDLSLVLLIQVSAAREIAMDAASAARDVTIHEYLHLFAISVLYYDHLITFSDEYQYMWKRRKNFSVICFFINRYLAFWGDLAVTLFSFRTLTEKSCRQYAFFRQILLVVNQVLVCLLLTLRTYALFGRDRRVLAFMLTSAVILATGAVWSLIGQHSFISNVLYGCHTGLSESTGIHLAIAWEALFVYDTLVFLLTLSKTYKARNHSNIMTHDRLPLMTLILRDGAFYFGVMALANLSNILTFYLAPPLLKGCLSTFASSISVSMMSRLMLNLHYSADNGILSGVTTMLLLTSDAPIFTSRLAPMEPPEQLLPSMENIPCTVYDPQHGTSVQHDTGISK